MVAWGVSDLIVVGSEIAADARTNEIRPFRRRSGRLWTEIHDVAAP